MTDRTSYRPGPANGARIDKHDDAWTLVLFRTLPHAPDAVWSALTDPAELRQWAPFDADHDMGHTGPVLLTTVGAPTPQVSESRVRRADAPHLLEYTWGGNAMRWELEPHASGTRLTLWHTIDRNYIAMGAAGWHICFDVLDRLLTGHPIGRIVGGDAMQFEWKRLYAEYGRELGVEKSDATPPAGNADEKDREAR